MTTRRPGQSLCLHQPELPSCSQRSAGGPQAFPDRLLPLPSTLISLFDLFVKTPVWSPPHGLVCMCVLTWKAAGYVSWRRIRAGARSALTPVSSLTLCFPRGGRAGPLPPSSTKHPGVTRSLVLAELSGARGLHQGGGLVMVWEQGAHQGRSARLPLREGQGCARPSRKCISALGGGREGPAPCQTLVPNSQGEIMSSFTFSPVLCLFSMHSSVILVSMMAW